MNLTVVGCARSLLGEARFTIAPLVARDSAGQLYRQSGNGEWKTLGTAAWNQAVEEERAVEINPMPYQSGLECWFFRVSFLGRQRAIAELRLSGALFQEPDTSASTWGCLVNGPVARVPRFNWLSHLYNTCMADMQRGRWAEAIAAAEQASDLDHQFSPPIVALLQHVAEHSPSGAERVKKLAARAVTNASAEYLADLAQRRQRLQLEIAPQIDTGRALASITGTESAWVEGSPHILAETCRRCLNRLKLDTTDLDARDDLAMALEEIRAQQLVTRYPLQSHP